MPSLQPNPVYTYNYQVSNDEEQTYITHTESRDGDQVNGEYSYVDPLGSLIIVRYTANDVDGYTETREVQEGFIQIRGQSGATSSSTATTSQVTTTQTRPVAVRPSGGSSSTDIVATIIAELQPFIRDTVSQTLQAQRSTTTRVTQPVAVAQTVRAVRPAVAAVSGGNSVESRFGVGGASNFRVETPEYQFATTF